MRKPIIAIDGPASSGKGTIARLLADRLGFAYLDTGLLYRALAYLGESQQPSVQDVLRVMKETPEETLRSEEIGNKASVIAGTQSVREMLLQLQRDFAANPGEKYNGSVLDGRDIATIVVPNADHKIFITAGLEIRVLRRLEFLRQNDPRITYEEVYENLAARDEQDRSRKIAPLVFNESYDALVDTSYDSIEESFGKVIRVITARF
ncbi:MAG: (d)CMP kinase [Holosporaceae bacterium]|jgi:cytidylate kinase|nr:(d)CMP kinase [Holosporaceae bacterium]